MVFDMASESEGVPSVFVRKDWLSILDNQNGSYQGNQSVIDTSQLANSNKYINYREAYLTVPMLMVLTSGAQTATVANAPLFASKPFDQTVGLKNWYGSIVHSFTLDYNGTTIIQQTPYIGLWNSFKLMTSLSWNDVASMGSQIGFYPDTSESVGKGGSSATTSQNAVVQATFNNQLASGLPFVLNALETSDSILSDSPTNLGLQKRQKMWNFNPQQVAGSNLSTAVCQAGPFFAGGATPASTGAQTLTGSGIAGLTNLWKSYLFKRVDTAAASAGVCEWAITAQIYLKHLHSFFERVPLLKGVFCKMTLNLNQTSVNFTCTGGTGTTTQGAFTACTVNSPLGGVSPLMVMAGTPVLVANDGDNIDGTDVALITSPGMGNPLLAYNSSYILSLQVGQRCLNSTQTGMTGTQVSNSPLGTSIILNAPAYSFSPVFEASYLADPVKKIVYSDVYQYQVLGVQSAAVFNNLITNGIANIKSVLVLPFYSSTSNGGLIPFQSQFECAGGGPTSPYVLFNQFNIQISGQNAIYNTERYAYEQWLNQTYGVNAVNGGMTDGLSSGLVSQKDFETLYSYYYVNCGRMLPVEEAVPKSVNIIGQNQSAFSVDLYIFVEYGVEIDIDILTGARV